MPRKPEPLPLTMRCPEGGEEWPTTSYKSTYDTGFAKFTGRCIKFHCPSNHYFTLTKAVKTGMLTVAQARRLIMIGRKEVEAYRKLSPAQQQKLLDDKFKEQNEATGW